MTQNTHDDSAGQDLARRLAELEALAAIRDAKARSVRAIDDSVSKAGAPDAVRAYITADYRWSAAPFGTTENAAAHLEFLRQFRAKVSYTMQFLSGPVIDLDLAKGEATGKWALWQPLTVKGESWILMGHSEDRAVRDADSWLLAETRLDVEVLAPWQSNWGANPISARWNW